MKCPFCYVPESKVIDSRPSDNGMSIRRRRECTSCGRKFTTYERVEDISLIVIIDINIARLPIIRIGATVVICQVRQVQGL